MPAYRRDIADFKLPTWQQFTADRRAVDRDRAESHPSLGRERIDWSAGIVTSVTPLTSCRLCGSEGLVTVLDLGEQALTGVFPASSDERVSAGPPETGLVSLVHTLAVGPQLRANRDVRRQLRVSLRAEPIHVPAPGAQGSGSRDVGRAHPAGRRPRHRQQRRHTPCVVFHEPVTTSSGLIRQPSGSRRIIRPTPRPSLTSSRRRRSARSACRPARIVTSIAMFYDLESPIAFARDVRELPRAATAFGIFEQSYMPSMLRSTAYDTVCHEHLEYYSLATVRRILSEADLELIDVRFNRVNGGSFAVTAARPDSPFTPHHVLIDWFIAQEERLGLGTPGPFRRFEERVFQHRTDLSQLIRAIREGGESVMGYGASTKGNVLLQFCGFGRAEIEAIAEVNEDKFGRVTPGSGIPIISEAEMRARRPDYLLVFPWHFRDGIVEREEEYLRSGGRLIFPLPEIEIVGA